MAKWFKYDSAVGAANNRVIISSGTAIDGEEYLQAESNTEVVLVRNYLFSGDDTKELVYNQSANTFAERDVTLTQTQKAFYAYMARDNALNITDKWVTLDVQNRLTYSQKKRLDTYRASVRDIENAAGFPNTHVWPTQPPLPTPLAPEAPYVLVDAGSIQGLTFTRASGGWYTDRNGSIKLALNDTPRVEWDISSGERYGILMEPAATNLKLDSHTIGSSPNWTLFRATANTIATTGPDRLVKGTKLIEDATSNTHFVRQTLTLAASTLYWDRILVKAAERPVLNHAVTSPGMTTNIVRFDANTGTILSGNCTVQLLLNNWWQLEIPYSTVTGGSTSIDYRLDTGAGATYLGNGSAGLFLYAAETKAELYPTSQVVTTTSTVTRSADLGTYTLTDELNDNEFTLYVEARWIGSSSYDNNNRVSVKISDGTIENVAGFINNNGRSGVTVRSGGVTQVSITGANNSSAVTRAAFGIKLNDFALSIDGSNTIVDTSVTMPVGMTTLELSGSGVHINDVRLWRKRLSDKQLIALTK